MFIWLRWLLLPVVLASLLWSSLFAACQDDWCGVIAGRRAPFNIAYIAVGVLVALLALWAFRRLARQPVRRRR